MPPDSRRTVRAIAAGVALAVATALVACAAPPSSSRPVVNAPVDATARPGTGVTTAATGDPATASRSSHMDGSWIVLPPRDRHGRRLVADSAQVLVETRLRAHGIAQVTRGRRAGGGTIDGAVKKRASTSVESSDGPAVASEFDAALARARADGHAHAVSVVVDEWESGRRPGDRPRVALSLVVHDLAVGRVVHEGRGVRTGRGGAGIAATADRAIGAALDGFRLEAGGRGAVAGSVSPVSPGSSVSAGIDAAASTVPAMRASGLEGSASRGDELSDSAREVSAAGVAAALAAPRTFGGDTPDGRSIDGLSGVDVPGFGLRVPAGPRHTDAATADAFEGRATAFFYGPDLPIASLAQFDRVVLEPDNATPDELAALAERGAATFAYLSVGEVGPGRAWRDAIDDAWIIGHNAAWDSDVMDLASDWSAFLETRVDDLVARGYAGLFLDTMDSHVAHASTPDARAEQARGLEALVRRIKVRHPALRLIANRGFEVMDEIGPLLEAVAAESLYARWDNAAGRHSAVPARDRDWLLGRLLAARDAHAVDLIAIDYVPPSRRETARAVAVRIAAHDIVPWVATPALDHVGVGTIDVVPREVLLPFDSRVNGAQADAEVHRLLATPLEYLGLVPVYHDVAALGLPPANLGGRYAGIAYWARGVDVSSELQGWIETQADAGVPLALFGASWIEPGSTLAARAGLVIEAPIEADVARVRTRDALVGFETSLPRRLDHLGRQVRSVAASNTVHLGLEDAAGRQADLIVTGPWGGLATQPGATWNDLDGIVHWIVDPYAFLRRAFALPDAPMPDVTSEDGRRLWLAHIDGDALPSWSELPGRQLGAEVVRERILDRWPVPHTISIVEAEMTRFPAYRDRRGRMFDVARELFARPNVEIASHTFSHPYRWGALAADRRAGTHNLPVTGYTYSPEREIGGSAAFIDRLLAPPGKRTEVMLWSGDALPNEADLAAADAAGLVNMNGGFTTITRAEPATSLVTPMARTVGPWTQVYAPIMNENVYTNDWLGPFDGFRRVIETFEMTERPRRLKPINVYYHFYIGTKAAGIRSLEEVYAWSLAQDVHPVTVGDYARRVRVFREAGTARRLDGSWRVHGLDGHRSLRIVGDDAPFVPVLGGGIVGVHRLHDGLYLGTDGADTVRVSLERATPTPTMTLSSTEEP